MRNAIIIHSVIGAVLVAPFLCVFLVGRSIGADQEPRALPPMYHNAQQISQQDAVAVEYNVVINRVITFQTPDRPDVVRNYYLDYMTLAGWWQERPYPANSGALKFMYGTTDSPDYFVEVVANSLDGGVTQVQLLMYADAGSEWPVSAD